MISLLRRYFRRSGVWDVFYLFLLQGPIGLQGSPGIAGETGPVGPQGVVGATGAPGAVVRYEWIRLRIDFQIII